MKGALVRATRHLRTRAAIQGLAWSPLGDKWHPCTIDRETGKSFGGNFADGDPERWECLAK